MRRDQNKTHSRILNDIALDPKLSSTSITTTSTVTDIDGMDEYKESNEEIANQMVLTVTQSTKNTTTDSRNHTLSVNLKEATPSYLSTDSEPLITPKLRNPNSVLISNIISQQTTVTAKDVESPSPLDNKYNLSTIKDETAWKLTNNPIQGRNKQSKSLWDKPKTPKKSIAKTRKSTMSVLSPSKATSANTDQDDDENDEKSTTKFEFRVQPKLVELERLPVSNYDANAHKSSLIEDIDNRAKFSMSSIMSDATENDTAKLLANQVSIDSIYKPLTTTPISRQTTDNSMMTIQIKKDSIITPINAETPTTTQQTPTTTFGRPVTPLTISSDFAMIDSTFDEDTKDEQSGHEPVLSVTTPIFTPTTTVQNGEITQNEQTPTMSAVQSSKASATLTLNSGTIFNYNDKLCEMIRSPSVFDRYRTNLSLDDRQKLLVVVMTKYTILAMTAVITTQLFVIMGVITTLATFHEQKDGELDDSIILNVLNTLYYFLWCIDCVIGALCCYLNFKMNDRLYHKLFICCDKKCRKICGEMAKRKMVEAKIDDRAETLQQYLLKDSNKSNVNGNKY